MSCSQLVDHAASVFALEIRRCGLRRAASLSIRCAIALPIAALVAYPAAAALLLEIKHQNSEPNHSASDTSASFGFTAWGSYWDTVTVPDVGHTFSAPLDALPDFQFGLTRHDHFDLILYFNSRDDRIASEALMNVHSETNPPAIVMDRFSPVLGPVLSGYRITNITRTINRFEAVQVSGSNFTHFGTQTIRVYGDPIPPLSGDFNQNGDVDAADYVVWRDRVVTHELMSNGVGQGLFEGRAVSQDYEFWRSNFGYSAFPQEPQVATLPEPDSGISIGFSTLFAAILLHRPQRMSSSCGQRISYCACLIAGYS